MSRKAGEKGLAEYVAYLNNYDRKARGAGSQKEPPTDRLSALDIRRIHERNEDFGINKYDAAREVLKYAARVEDKTRMGGGSERALDRLRALLKKEPKEKDRKPKDPKSPMPELPDPKPEPKPVPRTKQVMSGGPSQVGDNSPSQYVQQDNDIITSIYGNKNSVTNQQDNSVTQTNIDERDYSREYGGSVRVMNAGGDLPLMNLFGDGLFAGKYGFKVDKNGRYSNIG